MGIGEDMSEYITWYAVVEVEELFWAGNEIKSGNNKDICY